MINPQPDRPVTTDAVPGPQADWLVVRKLGHDINNLLGAVVGYTELLVEDTPPDAPHAADLRRVLESAQRASALVATLIDHVKRTQAADTTPR